jgi:hypothetical protein
MEVSGLFHVPAALSPEKQPPVGDVVSSRNDMNAVKEKKYISKIGIKSSDPNPTSS